MREAIKTKGVVTMKADVTKDNPKAYALMDELGNVAHSIPFLAVFSADNPHQPQILRDFFSKDDLLGILSEPPDPIEVEATLSEE